MAAIAAQKAAKIKEFSPKAAQFAFRHPAYDKRLNILTGAIRSSKTWQMLPKLALFLPFYEVAGERVITGVSKDSIYHNVLNDLFDLVGPANYTYNRQSGALELLGSKWSVVGAKDEGSEKYIRGRTIGIAYCDELTLMPKSFYMMLVGRMSPAGARLYATTNPDSPYHWVKTEILDNPDLRPDLWTQHYTLDDNPHLPEEYKQSLRRQFTGVFYRRFILGEWVLAEGAVYRDCLSDQNYYDDASRPLGLENRGGHIEHWVACDYGTTNPMVFLDIYDDGHTIWVDREYYWDSKKENRQKTDAEYAEDLMQFFGRADSREWPGVLVDPSAASFRAELQHRGIYVQEADNNVEDGIRRVSALLSQKKLRIHRRCTNTIRELQTYAWDEKKSDKGQEQPLKAHDHTCDAVRYYVQSRINDWRLSL
jgi:PBSX family phage terminase large subunit